MRNRILIVMVAFRCVKVHGEVRKVDFEQDTVGQPRFEVYFNGTKLYEVDDSTFTETGRVGVWTKADSITQFDDLTVTTK